MLDDSNHVPPLEISRVMPRYKHSRKRLILVDFEGTLWSRDLSSPGLVGMAQGDYVFPEEAVNILGNLAEDTRNEVWLLSGLRIDGVLEKVREKVPKVGIVYVFFLFCIKTVWILMQYLLQCGEWLFYQDTGCWLLYRGMDQHGIEFQSDMEECLFRDAQLCPSFIHSACPMWCLFRRFLSLIVH